jgi:hypothetical protein
MANIRYARPRLITAQDKRYRAHVEQFILQRQNQRAMRPPRQRDIFGGQAESALRDWLAGQLTLAETRILEYEEQRGRRANTKYRELDALVLERRSAWVFEIKASRTAHSLRRAVLQLRETRAILRLLYPQVAATVLLVDTGIPTAEDVAALMAEPEAPAKPPETLDETLAHLPQVALIHSLDEHSHDNETVDLMRFNVEDIIALAGAENLALDWDADDEAEPPPPPTDSGPAYSTASTDEQEEQDADNPFAAAFRRAGLTSDSDN